MIYAGKTWDKYEASDSGYIRNAKTKRVLKATPNKKGYYILVVRPNGQDCPIGIIVHRAIAETYLPNENKYEQVNHIDGNKTNNAVSNLEWCTQSQNMKHAVRMGLKTFDYCKGEKAYGAKLNEEKVRAIRKIYKEKKFTQEQLSEIYSCSRENIKAIVSGKSWAWVE